MKITDLKSITNLNLKDVSFDKIVRKSIYWLRHSRTVIFVVVLSAGLMMAILTLNDILQQALSGNLSGGYSQTDRTTITRLNKLQTSDKNASGATLPSGRINPFSE